MKIQVLVSRLIMAMVLLFLSALFAFGQRPTTNFSATPAAGCAPLLVNFTDQSTGNPTSWRWTLGNGSQSSNRNPSAVYMNPGTYTVKLVATNAAGSDSLIRTNYITVYSKPNIQFSASNNNGCGPLTVSFTDNSSAGSGTIQTRQWDFGDGTFSTEANPVHTYTSQGNFNVSLMVSNSFGCSASSTQNGYVQVIPKPTISFSSNNTSSCSFPFDATFQNQTTASGAISFLWQFGDGTSSTEINPTHSYRNPGSYSVKLKATGVGGCSDSLSRNNYINIQNNVVSFTAPDRACVNSLIQLTGTSSPTPSSTLWRFSNGTTTNDPSPVVSFSTPGIFYITKIDNFGGCMDSVTQSIEIVQKPVSNFAGTNLSSCRAPLVTSFTSNTSNTTSYLWNFGDGQTSNGANPQHTYTQEGSYDVSLIAGNSGGCFDTLIRTAYVTIQFPVVSVTHFPQPGCVPLTDTFSLSVTGGDAVASYLWNFGDGGTSTESTPTHTFSQRGKYDIQVIIRTASGCTDTAFYPQAVKAGNKPNPSFEAVTTTTCASESVTFNNLTPAADSADNWLWIFGDNTFSSAMSPSHLFIDTGIFDIQLLAFDNGCPSDTFIRPQYITVLAPIAKFSVINNCAQRLTKKFNDLSIGAESWLWDFGDGITSDEQSPEHTYNSSGRYTVKLTVNNATNNCSATKTFNILVSNEVPDFEANPLAICRTNSTNFRVTNFTPDYFSAFTWRFGDGITGSDTAVTKIYYTTGIYTVKLMSRDKNGCKDTITKNNYIQVNGPKSLFSATNTNNCINSLVAFTDNSTGDGRNAIVQRIWSWGDGSSDTTINQTSLSHQYLTNGNYTVRLRIIDAFGCENILSRQNYIRINSPAANFYTADTLACVNSNINLINSTTSPNVSFSWNFGDGRTSNVAAPVLSYPSQGTYSITLYVTNSIGCTDSLRRDNYIKVKNPIASYTANTYEGNCPPLVVNFNNTSQNYLSQLWDFGDGTSTNTDNPSHFYAISGNYTAKVTVTGPGGCTDTYQHAIIVHGPRGTLNYSNSPGCTPLLKTLQANVINTTEMVWDFNDGNTLQSMVATQNHTYTTEGVYLPKLLLKDATGCIVPVSGRDSIRVNNLHPAFEMGNHSFCRSGNVVFNNTSVATDAISSYLWNFGDGTTSSEQHPTHVYANPGNYIPTLTVQTVTGCSGTYQSSDTVTILSIPDAQILQSATEGCEGIGVVFNGSVNGLAAASVLWSWDFGNGNTSTVQNPPAQTFRTVGNNRITATVTNAAGCSNSLEAFVMVHPIPTVDAGPDTFSCRMIGIRLQATGADIYNWSPAIGLSCINCANPLANPTTGLYYRVTGKTNFGCQNIDSVYVSVINPFTLSVSPPDSVCKGNSKQLSASGGYRYTWSPNTGLDNPNIANPTATPDVTTIYNVVATDEKACFTKSKVVPITVHNNPTVDLDEETTVTVGRTIDLIPRVSRDVIDARWSPTTSIFRTDFPGITVKPSETTTFTIDVFNSHRCTASDRITVNVMCNNSNMFIPNSFSPNGDGMNDIFYPRGTGIFTIKSMRIFSRWGEVIYQRNNFKANDPTKGWDGLFKGQKMNADAFVYTVEVVCENNTEMTFKGTVTLIR